MSIFLPLTIKQLDTMMCDTPGCDHSNHDGLFIHARCHPQSGLNVLYRFGTLAITCKQCKQPVCQIEVAE